MNKDTNVYRGKVKIDFKHNGTIVRRTTHNAGLSDMALLFAKAVTGNLNYSTDVPRLIDIGYIVPSATTTDYTYSNGIWMSILNEPANIGGRQFKYDKDLENWVGILTSTVYYSNLNGGILDEILSQVEDGQIELKVRLCSYEYKNRKYFAEIPITKSEIEEIKDSTSAIFSWYTELIYDSEELGSMNSDVTVKS